MTERLSDANQHGERELRLHHLAAWRESTRFVPRAFGLTKANLQ